MWPVSPRGSESTIYKHTGRMACDQKTETEDPPHSLEVRHPPQAPVFERCPRRVALFWDAAEHLGGGASLEEVRHLGEGLEV